MFLSFSTICTVQAIGKNVNQNMIEGITINNFRGIHKCRIDGLSQVNLFFGKNNCGKSSLLEAVFLVCGQSNPLLPASINAMRTYNRISEQDIRYFFYKMDISKEISISTYGGQERHLDISAFQQMSNVDVNNVSTELLHQYGLKMRFSTNEGEYNSEVQYDTHDPNKIEQKSQVDSRYVEKLKCMYLSPRYDSNASLEGLQNIYLNKDEEFLAAALKLLEPAAKDPVFIENVMLVDVGLSQRIPINLMGDGIRKIVSFLTSIYACRGGVVLFDELSNGFHHSVMKPMWDIVIRAAVKNDVQVFATTHDEDSIRGFQQAAFDFSNEKGKEVASGFKLQKIKDDELKEYRFSINQIGYAMEQEMEIR